MENFLLYNSCRDSRSNCSTSSSICSSDTAAMTSIIVQRHPLRMSSCRQCAGKSHLISRRIQSSLAIVGASSRSSSSFKKRCTHVHHGRRTIISVCVYVCIYEEIGAVFPSSSNLFLVESFQSGNG